MKLRSSEHMVFLCDANAQTANSSERGCNITVGIKGVYFTWKCFLMCIIVLNDHDDKNSSVR